MRRESGKQPAELGTAFHTLEREMIRPLVMLLASIEELVYLDLILGIICINLQEFNLGISWNYLH